MLRDFNQPLCEKKVYILDFQFVHKITCCWFRGSMDLFLSQYIQHYFVIIDLVHAPACVMKAPDGICCLFEKLYHQKAWDSYTCNEFREVCFPTVWQILHAVQAVSKSDKSVSKSMLSLSRNPLFVTECADPTRYFTGGMEFHSQVNIIWNTCWL